MLNSITVVTSCTAERDTLRDDQCNKDAKFVAFTDRRYNSRIWDERPAVDIFQSPRRNSRAPKILVHKYLDADYSIWVDATVALLVPASQIIDTWLKNADLAVFRHEKRGCLYEEARECAARHLDNPDLINEQVRQYRACGIREGLGLGRCTVIARRHTRSIEEFGNLWWSEYCRYSVRDQLSFMYSVMRLGMPVNFIDASIHHHPFFNVRGRPAKPEPIAGQ